MTEFMKVGVLGCDQCSSFFMDWSNSETSHNFGNSSADLSLNPNHGPQPYRSKGKGNKTAMVQLGISGF